VKKTVILEKSFAAQSSCHAKIVACLGL